MAGPCAIESSSQLMETAFAVKKSGATFLRGGAYKAENLPLPFQGLETEGLKYMKEAREATGLFRYLRSYQRPCNRVRRTVCGYAPDRSQEHAEFRTFKRSRKNFLPILLKRGLSATIDEWLNAAEYIMSEGNENVVLCERGSAPMRHLPGIRWI